MNQVSPDREWLKKEQLLANTIITAAHQADFVYVGFSGGVDSSYLLLKTVEVLGSQGVVAVTVNAPTSSSQDIHEATRFAKKIGVKQIVLDAPEFNNPIFIENNPLRCYHCKRSRYEAILGLHDNSYRITMFDGTQADDNPLDRPGSVAIKELNVVTPLADSGITKQEIRAELIRLGFNALASKQAEPCLATRIPFGRPILEMELEMVRFGEKILKERDLKISRLRHHGNLARIVTDESGIRMLLTDNVLRREISLHLKNLGFMFVTMDMEEYGSVG